MIRVLPILIPVLLLVPGCRPTDLSTTSSGTPRSYEAFRIDGQITIDGSLKDPAWSATRWTEDFVDILGADAPSPPLRTRAKLLWNDTHLYVAAELEEPHLWATLIERDAIVYRDDDFEVFLDPDSDGLEYFEIEVNAFATILDLFMNKPYGEGGRADISWNVPGLKVGVALVGTLNDPTDQDHGWSVEMAIPWAALVPPGQARSSAGADPSPNTHGQPPQPGDTWRINFSRVDWPLETSGESYRKKAEPSRENRHPESNWVWSPQGDINMHLPEKWGLVRFR